MSSNEIIRNLYDYNYMLPQSQIMNHMGKYINKNAGATADKIQIRQAAAKTGKISYTHGSHSSCRSSSVTFSSKAAKSNSAKKMIKTANKGTESVKKNLKPRLNFKTEAEKRKYQQGVLAKDDQNQAKIDSERTFGERLLTVGSDFKRFAEKNSDSLVRKLGIDPNTPKGKYSSKILSLSQEALFSSTIGASFIRLENLNTSLSSSKNVEKELNSYTTRVYGKNERDLEIEKNRAASLPAKIHSDTNMFKPTKTDSLAAKKVSSPLNAKEKKEAVKKIYTLTKPGVRAINKTFKNNFFNTLGTGMNLYALDYDSTVFVENLKKENKDLYDYGTVSSNGSKMIKDGFALGYPIAEKQLTKAVEKSIEGKVSGEIKKQIMKENVPSVHSEIKARMNAYLEIPTSVMSLVDSGMDIRNGGTNLFDFQKDWRQNAVGGKQMIKGVINSVSAVASTAIPIGKEKAVKDAALINTAAKAAPFLKMASAGTNVFIDSAFNHYMNSVERIDAVKANNNFDFVQKRIAKDQIRREEMEEFLQEGGEIFGTVKDAFFEDVRRRDADIGENLRKKYTPQQLERMQDTSTNPNFGMCK